MRATVFDGDSELVRTVPLVGVVDGAKGTVVGWWTNNMSATEGGTIISITNTGDPTNQRFIVRKDGISNSLQVILNNDTGTTLWDTLSTTTYTTLSATTWHHFVASWDLSAATPVAKLYIKNTDETNDTTAPQSGVVNYRPDNYQCKIGEGFEGSMAEVVFWPGAYVDLTDVNVRKRFISQDGQTGVANPGPTAGVGKPVGYGYRGELATRGTAGCRYLQHSVRCQ